LHRFKLAIPDSPHTESRRPWPSGGCKEQITVRDLAARTAAAELPLDRRGAPQQARSTADQEVGRYLHAPERRTVVGRRLVLRRQLLGVLEHGVRNNGSQ